MALLGKGQFDMADDGGIRACPMLSWACTTLADTFVLLNLRYAQNREELATGGRAVQMTMSPHQALELADALLSRAELVLSQKPAARAN